MNPTVVSIISVLVSALVSMSVFAAIQQWRLARIRAEVAVLSQQLQQAADMVQDLKRQALKDRIRGTHMGVLDGPREPRRYSRPGDAPCGEIALPGSGGVCFLGTDEEV